MPRHDLDAPPERAVGRQRQKVLSLLKKTTDRLDYGEIVSLFATHLGGSAQVRSVLNSFGEETVQICTCPPVEVAASAPEVVRGIEQGLIQEVNDLNADAVGARYQASVTPDPHGGSCEVSLVLRPGR